MVTPSGSFPAGSQAAAALGASENGLYFDYDLDVQNQILSTLCLTALGAV